MRVGTPGTERRVALSFSNGWRPGEVEAKTADDVAAAIEMLANGGWCWPPDESSNAALPIDYGMLADHLRSGDRAFLISPASGGLVLLQPSSGENDSGEPSATVST